MPVPLPGLFDYRVPDRLPMPHPGQRVAVTFGRRRVSAVVMECTDQSDVAANKIQDLDTVLDQGICVMTAEQLGLLRWCADYYKHPLGEVVANALPPGLRSPEGRLPDAPVEYALTSAGIARYEEGPGRAKAQWAILERLTMAPAGLTALRTVRADAIKIVRALIEKQWVLEQPWKPSNGEFKVGPQLTPEQARTVADLSSQLKGFSAHLLDGITGSGKTEVYLCLLEKILAADLQALVLVPEIGLTPQLVRRFTDRLGIEPVVSHSNISAGERMQAWARCLRGQARLVLGTRSALFLPLPRPGLIVMDESHDSSFKQQDGFRFSARDVAVKRAHGLEVPVVLGTATPSLETLHNAGTERYQWHRLRHRATGASEPKHRVVDLRQQATEGGLSKPVLKAIGQTLERGEQVLVFLNRRGYAPVLLCHDCGWHASCPACDSNLTWHRSSSVLVCHHCEQRNRVPRFCPDCRADALQGAGEGTEQLEKSLQGMFPDSPLYRVDRDSIRRKGELEEVITRVRTGEPCILVGTQMLAKGHHFPKVTLVVIVNLDQALYSADFRALERMGQVLLQVAGRAGREEHPGTVILQTHHPDHLALQRLLTDGYEAFASEILQERELAALPPFAFQAIIRAEAQDRDRVLEFLNKAASLFKGVASRGYGPFPAMMERKGGRIRWYLLIQSGSRPALQNELNTYIAELRRLPEARKVRWAVDIDPQDF